MSAEQKIMYAMRCDYLGGCSRELESYDGGAWLYDSPEEARKAAYDADWVTDVDGSDYCDLHRDAATPDEIVAATHESEGSK